MPSTLIPHRWSHAPTGPGRRRVAGRCGAVAALLLVVACGSTNDPVRLPALPVDDVLLAAENNAFRTIEARSFQQAIVLYPADGGQHYVPVGDYLATRLARAFPAGASVNGLRLDRWDSVCETGGVLSDSVDCAVAARASFQLQGRVREIRFGVAATTLGDQASLGREAGYRVSYETDDESLAGQIRRLVDLSARSFADQVQPLLLADQERRLF